ncbi:MAG: hypothetical protein ACRYGG_23915 [Janthinobacterium lividum]
MSNFILMIAAISICVLVWCGSARHWRRTGRTALASRIWGGIFGVLASVLCVVVAVSQMEPASPKPPMKGAAQSRKVEASSAAVSAAPAMTRKSASASPVTAEVAGDQPSKKAGDSISTASAPAQVLTAASSPAAVHKVEDSVLADESIPSDQEPPAPNLGFAPDAFQTRFNQVLKRAGMPFRARLRKEVGAVNDVVRASLNDHLILLGTVDKTNGQIKAMTLLANGDGTVKSGANMLIVAIAMFAAVTPNGSAKTMGPEVLALIKDYDEDSEESSSRIYNGVKFSHSRGKELGTFFSAAPA